MATVIEDVSKTFEEKQVLDHFTLALPQKGTVALLGPSGCGKTTLLRLIAGLEKPDSGAVQLEPNTRLSYIFQEDRLLPSLTARANIAAVLSYGERAAELLAEQWLIRLGLEGEGEHYPSQLSGGMKRRVAIGRALAYGGQVLLLDEPFKGLDLETKTQLQNIVLTGHDARNRLNLLVTHDVEEALFFANTIFLMGGPPLQIKDTVAVDIPVERRREAEDILVWHREYILRKM